VEKIIMKLIFNKKKCKECLIDFTPTSGVQLFCSPICKRTYYKIVDLKKERLDCPTCHAIFIPNSHLQKYCSAKCNVKRNGKVVREVEIIKCKQCEKPMEKTFYQNKFCNKICRDIYNKNKKKLIKECRVCKKTFLSNFGSIYCSNYCRSEGIRNPPRRIEERNCVICINKYSCVVSKKKQTCSRKCQSVLIGIKNKGKGHKTSEATKLKQSLTRKRMIAIGEIKISPKSSRSKHTYYKDIMFRSTWEVKVAMYLDDNNIKWEYENHKRKIPLKNGSSYIVDFYLPEMDKYIEVKGWWDESSIKKCDRLIEYFDMDLSKLIIVDKNNINDINLNRYYSEQSDMCCKFEERQNEI